MYMQTIVPNLWFDGRVEEAVEFYTSTFANSSKGYVAHYADAGKEIHGHNAGDVLTANFTIEDMEFVIINGGPLFKPNPSISFTVNCVSNEELDHLWQSLSDGGQVLMELGTYPFSEYYGWVNDKFGVSWQLIVQSEPQANKIIPSLMYTQGQAGKAEEAINFYTSVFPDSHIGTVTHYGAGMEPDTEAMVAHADFTVMGQSLIAQESAREHMFAFNEGVSLQVTFDTQEEIDEYWAKLSADPEAEACGWLKDKYGVSWQVVPRVMDEMMRNATPEQMERVMAAYMPMKKFDIAALQAAYSQ
jgi:predicted 3-demethylubiquinone-9 3-methyltransferase (glyoxalase superfamily)